MFAKSNRIVLAAVAGPLALIATLHPGHAAPAPAPARAEARATAAASATVQLPHISIVAVGQGSPVVLIPGLSSPRAVYDAVAAELSKRHQVLLVQVNGFAGDAPGENLKPGLLAGAVADLHGYLAARKLSAVPVIGHSMGGLLTLMWAKAHPGDVAKGMIVDSLPFVGTIFVPGSTPVTIEPQARAIRDRMAASYGQPANTAYVEATANGLALKPESRAKVKAWMLATDPRVSAQALYEDMTTDVGPDLPNITAPLTIVVPHGGMLTEAQATALYRDAFSRAPKATIVPIADAAHFVMLDQPAAFQAAVDAFLAK